ncbi:MAG: glucosamine-6-phosphate deaminase, partial [Planctomycetota bacterium]
MQVIIRPTREAASGLVARLVAREVRARPDLVLGLATGRTMERLYAILVRMCREEGLDFSRCRSFNLDEYVGLPPSDENSYRHYMERHLFGHINIKPRNTHLPDGMVKDLAAECRRYEEKIAACGGIDLQVLGLGRAGHIGFNEPLSALRSRTRDKSLTPMTIAENSTLFSDPARMPRRAITMGVGTILECRRLVMLVTGKSKAEVLAKAVEGPITGMISASAIQL